MAGNRARVDAIGLAASVSAVGAAAAASTLVAGRRRAWYDGLDKPVLTPPFAVFAPAWGMVYASQAIAVWLVWRGDAERGQYDVPALSSYWVQLTLNLVWTLLFFGLKKPAWALAEICVLWLGIAFTMREFARQHKYAAMLLLPYLAWISYAGVINLGIWWRNR